MTYSDYSLSSDEYQIYVAAKKSSRLDEIWDDLVARIDDPKLRKEATSKGYIVIDNPDLEDDVIASYKMFQVPNASPDLQQYIEENLYPFVVCLKA